MPPAPAATAIHGAFDTTVHAQPLPAVTVTVPGPPWSLTGSEVGEIVYVHGGGGGGANAACATVNVWPAIVIVPLRPAPVLGATAKATVPPPLPELPFEIEIQGAFETAVHAHPPSVVTAIVPDPPASVNA